jgi:predicted dehydrogenase
MNSTNPQAKKTRIGVVGLGYGQKVLIPAFRRDPRCEVVGVAASTEAHARQVAKTMGVSAGYSGWRNLIECDDIEAVAIALPPVLQPMAALHSIRCGKPVFCEKPLATSTDEARKLFKAAADHNVANVIDFVFPEVPELRKMQTLLREGAIGSLRHIGLNWSVETYSNRIGADSWKSQPDKGGGALANFFSHSFHYLEWLVGPITTINATLFRSPTDCRDGETFAVMALEFASGLGASAVLATAAPLTHRHRLELFGDEGLLVVENDTEDYVHGFRLFRGSHGGDIRRVPIVDIAWDNGLDGRILAASSIASRFLDWILLEKPARPNFGDGLRVQVLLDSALRSHDLGHRVDVPVPSISE